MPLGLDEARTRAELVQVDTTHVRLDLTEDSLFRSATRIEFSCRRPGAATWLDVVVDELISATLNGQPLDPSDLVDGRLTLPHLAEHNVVEVDGLMRYSSDGEGMHSHLDPADGRRYVYAMSFLDAAPRWLACFDQPDLKSRFSALVTAPAPWRVLSNAPAEPVAEGEGTRTWAVAQTPPLSTYLLTLAAGEWASVTAEHDGITLGVHARLSRADDLTAQAPDLLATTAECFDDYHRLFGLRYPFGDYHQVFVPDFNAGAMENPGCVLLRDELLFRGAVTRREVGQRAGTIAHEMAHMWFGDLVTMRWWDDLWLNESFAEHMALSVVTARGRHDLWTDFGMKRKLWGGLADRSPSTHPVAQTGAPNTEVALSNFDGISYAKGAALLRQLVKALGEEAFLAGLRRHFEAFAWGNASAAELLEHLEAASGVQLAEWSETWLTTTGMDALTVTGDAVVVAAADGDAPARSHAVDVARLGADGAELSRAPLTLVPGRTEVGAGEGLLVPDAGDDAWAVSRLLEPDTSALSLPPISAVADPATRVALWSSVRWGVRDALVDPREALELVLREVGDEPDDTIADLLLDWANGSLVPTGLPFDERTAAMARFSEVVDRLHDATAPGTDRALTLLRSRISASADPAWLADFLDSGTAEAADPQLRWSALCRLAFLDEPFDRITAELARDRSSFGAVQAARARALVPREGSKEAALSAVLTSDKMPPHELYATAAALFDGEQGAMLEPYALRFFEGLAGVGRIRKGWVLGSSIQHAFPDGVATPAVLAAAEAALEEDLPTAVRRVVVDGCERLRLTLASLAAFPGEDRGQAR